MAANADIVGEVEGFLWKLDLTLWKGDLLETGDTIAKSRPFPRPFPEKQSNSQTVCISKKSVRVF